MMITRSKIIITVISVILLFLANMLSYYLVNHGLKLNLSFVIAFTLLQSVYLSIYFNSLLNGRFKLFVAITLFESVLIVLGNYIIKFDYFVLLFLGLRYGMLSVAVFYLMLYVIDLFSEFILNHNWQVVNILLLTAMTVISVTSVFVTSTFIPKSLYNVMRILVKKLMPDDRRRKHF